MDDDRYRTLGRELLDSGLVLDGGAEGLYGRTLVYEEIMAGVIGLTTRTGADDGAMTVHFPPVIPRALLEKTDYLKSFPDLTGSVHTFRGDDKLHARLLGLVDAGQDWVEVLEPAEVVLRPAACHPVYPLCTDGRLPAGGRRFEVHGWCFRHEPSPDPTRMMAFRMHEFVYVGDPAGGDAHRDVWVKRGTEMLESLGLDVEVVVANDPFFGRVGKMMAAHRARRGPQVGVRDPGHLEGVPHGHRLGQPPSGPLRGDLRNPVGRRRRGPLGLLRRGGGPDRPGPPGHPRTRSRSVAGRSGTGLAQGAGPATSGGAAAATVRWRGPLMRLCSHAIGGLRSGPG